MTLPCNKSYAILVIVLLAVSVLGLYGQVASHGFINFDDPDYVYANPNIENGLSTASIYWAFTTTHAANWHPVTWLFHMLVVQFFALNPAAHHLLNVFLHAANSTLLFLLLNALTGKLRHSAVAAALFALHPLHVESVAWVAELKDVLSAFFGLLTICLYMWYLKRPDWRRYALMLSCFAMGLMAKPMLVTLPLLLLLLDYWPLRRLDDDTEAKNKRFWMAVREKIPLFSLVAASCAITVYAQHNGHAIRSLAESPLSSRVGNALLAYLGYLGKTFWPHNLAVLYPLPAVTPFWKPCAAGIMIATITFFTVTSRKRYPNIFLGWFWYLLTLVPVIGIVQVGQQAMADRYTYLPLIGIFIALVFEVDQVTAGWRNQRMVLWSGTVIMLSLCTFSSWQQLSFWQSNTTLYEHTLAVTRDNYAIHNNYGFALDSEGRFEEALHHYQEAIHIAPWYAKSYLNKGITLRKKGQLDNGVFFVREAIRLDPDVAAAYIELGLNRLLKNAPDEAIRNFNIALKIDPGLADGYYNMGLAFAGQGKSLEAIKQFTKALSLKPDDYDCHYYLGIELAGQQRYDEAITHFTAVINMKPDPEMEQMARQSLNRVAQQKKCNP